MVIFNELFQTVRLSKWYLHFDTPSFVYAESCAKLPQSVYEGYPPVFAELSAIRFRKIPKTTFDGDFQQRQLDWSGDFAYICR